MYTIANGKFIGPGLRLEVSGDKTLKEILPDVLVDIANQAYLEGRRSVPAMHDHRDLPRHAARVLRAVTAIAPLNGKTDEAATFIERLLEEHA